MTVCWNQPGCPFNATHGGLLLAVDSEGKHFVVYYKPAGPSSPQWPWQQLLKTDPVYELCKIWRFAFEKSMPLQEFLDRSI